MIESVYIVDKETNISYYLVGIVSISPSNDISLTQYPIPEGGFISDHYYKNPNSLSMQLSVDGLDSTNKSYYIDTNNNHVNLTYDSTKELLNNWLNNAVQLDIQTRHALFRNMVLSNLSWQEDANSWTKYNPSLSFKEVKIAHVYTTTINALNTNYGADYSVESDISTGDTNGNEINVESTLGNIAAGATLGAVVGGSVGSFIPVIGTGIGAVLGGMIGGGINAVVGFFKDLGGQ